MSSTAATMLRDALAVYPGKTGEDLVPGVATEEAERLGPLPVLLLAAAPHLADLLDRIGEPTTVLPNDTRALIDAITKVGESL